MLYIGIICALVGLDQLIKLWATKVLQEVSTIAIIPNALHLTYVRNDGAAFSILRGQQWLLIGVTSVAIAAIVFVLLSKRLSGKFIPFCLALIAGGGIGNLIDRITLGYVVDYVDFRLINYAIFNLADSCVVVGATLICIYILYHEIRQKKEQRTAKTKNAAEGNHYEN